MKIIKFNLLIFFILIIFASIVFEIYLRINSKFISDNIELMSSTKLKKKLVYDLTRFNFNNLDEQLVLFDDVYLKVAMNTYYKKASIEDKFNGAVDFIFKNNGFCNHHDNYNQSKVITVGDSFTQCTQIRPEDTWSYKIYNFEDNKKISNLGMQATGPAMYNKVLKKHLRANQIVYYAFYEGNDFYDLKISKFYNKKNYLIKRKIFKFINKTLGNSYLFNYLVVAKRFNKIKNRNKKNINFQFINKSSLYKYKLFNTNNSNLREIKLAKNFDENKKYYKINLERLFLEAKNIVNKKNGIIVFIYFPSAHSAFGKKNVEFVDSDLQNLMFNFSDKSQKLFDNLCAKHKLNCLNTVNDLIKFNLKSKIPSHFNTNGHLTPSGSSFISRIIRNYTCGIKNIKNNVSILNFEKLCIESK